MDGVTIELAVPLVGAVVLSREENVEPMVKAPQALEVCAAAGKLTAVSGRAEELGMNIARR